MNNAMKSIGCGICLVATASLAGLAVVGCAGNRTHESTGEVVDDSAITTKVKAELLKDPAVKSFEIKVETFKGVVQLSGFVDNNDQIHEAEVVARAVPGVVSVKNNLALK